MARLAKDPRFLYPNTDEGRQAALAEYKRMIDAQLVRSRQVIGMSPKAPIEVKRVPEFKEKTAPGAYYDMPALDGSRPGVFYANLRNMNDLPKFGMRTLSIHEGVPGHHFQIALAQEQQGGPTFRKVLPFTGLHGRLGTVCEWLGSELGVYQNDPFSDLGRLQAEMFRAVRLVVTPASTASAGRASRPSPTWSATPASQRPRSPPRSSATSSTRPGLRLQGRHARDSRGPRAGREGARREVERRGREGLP